MRRSRAFIGSPPEWELWSNLRFPCGNVNGISDGFHTYSYDADGNLTQVDGGATARYLYNALNQRIRTEVGGTVREFVFHLNGQRVSVWDGTSGQLLQAEAYWQGSPFEFSSSGTAHFQHFDQLGTVRVQTSYNGAVEGAYQSLAFGDGYSLVSGTDSDAYHYAMLDHDAETDTHHGWFRQYSSAQGRWMSPDPYDGSYDFSNPQSLNRYSYVLNNPLAYADPWGMNICVIIGGDTWSITAGGTTTSGSDPGTLICTSDPSGGGGGGGGGAGNGPTLKAPSNGSRTKQILQCASKVANQFSIAGVLGINEEAHPFLASISNAFLGNTFSGITDAVTHVATGQVGATAGDLALGGYSQGLPIGSGIYAKGIAGVATDAGVNAVTNPGAVLSVTGAATELGEE